MAGRGRDKIYNVDDIVIAFNKYIDETEDSLVQEFAYNYGINRDTLYELAKDSIKLSDTMSRAIQKQEIYLLKQGTKVKTLDSNIVRLRLIQPCHNFQDKQTISADITARPALSPALEGLTADEIRLLIDSIQYKALVD